MNLIAPLFLGGLALLALPLWLHRLNTRSPERQPFSSAMLLEQTTTETHVRKQLRYRALLAARLLFLLLLALAFARPVWERPPTVLAGEGSVLHLIVVDTSFSMTREGALDTARAEALGLLAGFDVEDPVQIVSAGGRFEIIDTPGTDRDLTRAQLARLTTGFGRLDYGTVITGLDTLAADYGGELEAHLISDFQQTALTSRFTDLIPDALKHNLRGLALHPIDTGSDGNVYIDRITRTDNGIEVGFRAGNLDAPLRIQPQLQINDEQQTGEEIILESGATGRQLFVVTELADTENLLTAELAADDRLLADNRRHAVIDNTPPRPVLLLTADPEGLPVKYLAAAVEASRQGYRVEPVRVTDLDPRILGRYGWLLIDDLGIVDERLAVDLLAYLDTGGAILAASGARAETRAALPVAGYPVRNSRLASSGQAPLGVARVDSSHAALAATAGWRDIRVARYLTLDLPAAARTLVGLENGAALLVEQRIGNGRLLLLTGALDNVWSDLPVRPVFVNFIAEAGRYLSGDQRLVREQVAGDFLQLTASGIAAGQVTDPDGRELLSLADTHRGGDIRLDKTGFYRVYTGDGEAAIAVNPDLRESDLTPMSTEAIAAWREAVTPPSETANRQSATVNSTREPVELWHILLLLLGFVVLVESLLGNRYLASGRGVA